MSLINWGRNFFFRKQDIFQILRSFVVLSGSSALAQVIAFVNSVLLARTLSPVGLGQITGTYSVVGITALLMNWGLDGWFLREGTMHPEPRKMVGEVMTLKAILGIAWGLGLFFILPLVNPDTFDLQLLGLCILDIWFTSLFNVQLTTLNITNRISTQSELLFGLQFGRLLGTLLLILLGVRSVPIYVLIRLISSIVLFTIAVGTVCPLFAATIRYIHWSYLRLSSSFAINDLLAAIYMQADVSLLTLLIGPGANVGLYSSASGIVNAIFVIPNAGYNILLPKMTRIYNNKDQSFFRIIKNIFIAFTLLGACMSLCLFIGGRFLIVAIFGTDYLLSGDVLAILSPILLLKSINFAAAVLLVTINWQRYRALVQMFSAVANVVLNLLIIIPFGIQGVAYVYVASEMILMIGYIFLSLRGVRSTRLTWQQRSIPDPSRKTAQ